MTARSQSTPRAHVPGWVRYFNSVARRLLEVGMPMGPNGLLTVRGRKSGLPRTTPVTIVQRNDQRWLIGVYGETDWVRNLRASGQATITRRGHSLQVAASELSQVEAVAFFRDVFPATVRRYGSLGAWIVRKVDKIDINNPTDAANGRPVFELR